MSLVLTEAEEEYLEAIYRLSRAQEPVSLGLLAKNLGFSPVSVNEMVRKMADKELVDYKPYAGVSLTPQGFTRAETMIRRHRLWERFLADVLSYPWDRVHEEACRLEHATSELLEAYLIEFLHEPRTCPHGRLLPGLQGALEDSCELAVMAAGQRGEVLAILDEDAAFLSTLDQAGLRPGSMLEVMRVEPALHSVTVRVGQNILSFAVDRARQILVLSIEAQAPAAELAARAEGK